MVLVSSAVHIPRKYLLGIVFMVQFTLSQHGFSLNSINGSEKFSRIFYM